MLKQIINILGLSEGWGGVGKVGSDQGTVPLGNQLHLWRSVHSFPVGGGGPVDRRGALGDVGPYASVSPAGLLHRVGSCHLHRSCLRRREIKSNALDVSVSSANNAITTGYNVKYISDYLSCVIR